MAKPSVTLRNTKGSALTFTELDTNFQNLRDSTISIAGGDSSNIQLDLNDTLTLSAGSGVQLAFDPVAKEITFTSTAIYSTWDSLGTLTWDDLG